MKKRSLFVTLALGLSLTLALLWILGSQSPSAVAAPGAGHVEAPNASAAELHVCPTGCTYSSVQAAVDAASDGDVIKVAAGSYTDVHVRPRNDVTTTGLVTQVVYISKTVTIQGGYTATNWTTPDPQANLTTLDAQRQGRVIYITGDIHPTIEGLRITGGDAHGLGGVPWGWDTGGGVYVITATAVISNNHVFSNTCSSPLSLGGGMSLWSSAATISGNAFDFNTVGFGGGGLYQAWNSPVIDGNVFAYNTATTGGGGIWISGSEGTFEGNIVTSNTADIGGGLTSEIGSEMLINNIIADNHVSTAGGGLWVYGSSPQLLHNTIARNSGGDGSGVYLSQVEWMGPINSTATFTNTILASHTVGISVTGGNTVTANGVLWYDTPITVSKSITAVVTVLNQHTGDPAFGPDGYHLMAGSAAMDKGIDAGITSDIDGEWRPAGAGHDLGADELWHKIYLPLVIRNYQP